MLLTLACVLGTFVSTCNSQTYVQVNAITALTEDGALGGRSITAGSKLAADRINANASILPDYILFIEALDTESEEFNALLKSLEVTGAMDTCNVNDTDSLFPEVPVVLGCPWSSLSIMSNPALSAFQWAQISSASTSILLSDTGSYPTFYRSISSDALQAEGLVELCAAFGWTRIAVIYVNDNYGIYLTISLLAKAEKLEIDTSAIGYTSEETDTMATAARQLEETKVFVTILIVHSWDMEAMLDELGKQDLLGYPYYYIGTDTWMSELEIQTYDLTDRVQGYIGTFPWKPGEDATDSYFNTTSLQTIYDVSSELAAEMEAAWAEHYENNPNYVYNVSEPQTFSYYGWESMYILAYALEVFDQEYGLDNYFAGDINNTLFMEYFDEILANRISYLGITGNVSFDENGDRLNGLWGYGYVTGEGQVEYFGLFYQENGTVEAIINKSTIEWPWDFVAEGVEPPRSDPETKSNVATISEAGFWSMVAFSILSVIVALVYMGITVTFRDKKILKAASWRLNVVMCVGCILAYIDVILYGLDERWFDRKSTELHFFCNLRFWVGVIAFTIGFSPLFMKTYRISKIFTSADLLQEYKLEDPVLIRYIAIIVGIDILLLSILTGIDPHIRKYDDGRLEEVDKLQYTQHEYGTCLCKIDFYNYIYYAIILIWKAIEIFWGTYLVSIVCRVGLKQVTKFDETGPILVAIVFGVIVAAAITPVVFIYPVKDSEGVTVRYCVMAAAILVIYNVGLAANILPRLCAIYGGNEDKYSESPEEKMRRMIAKRLKKMGVDPGEFQTPKKTPAAPSTAGSDPPEVELPVAHTSRQEETQKSTSTPPGTQIQYADDQTNANNSLSHTPPDENQPTADTTEDAADTSTGNQGGSYKD